MAKLVKSHWDVYWTKSTVYTVYVDFFVSQTSISKILCPNNKTNIQNQIHWLQILGAYIKLLGGVQEFYILLIFLSDHIKYASTSLVTRYLIKSWILVLWTYTYTFIQLFQMELVIRNVPVYFTWSFLYWFGHSIWHNPAIV